MIIEQKRKGKDEETDVLVDPFFVFVITYVFVSARVFLCLVIPMLKMIKQNKQD